MEKSHSLGIHSELHIVAAPMTAVGADSDDSGSRLAFDIISSFILALTALAGACAPLYLAGYRVLFGGVQARPYTSVPHHEAGVENGDEFRDRKDGILSSSQRSHDHGVEKRSLAFVIGNMFSAGVMVSAGLCHLLGEAIRDMSLHLSVIGGDGDTGSSHAFPWATFLCGCGLLITLCADKAASIMSSGGPGRHGSGHGHQDIELTMGRSVGHDSNATVIEARPVTEMNGHHHHHLPPQAKVSFITAMLMGVALSFHSLLEGAALGAQETIANSMHIFIAIVSHKGLAAYALGSSLIESKVEYVGVFLSMNIIPPNTYSLRS